MNKSVKGLLSDFNASSEIRVVLHEHEEIHCLSEFLTRVPTWFPLTSIRLICFCKSFDHQFYLFNSDTTKSFE